ncbi:MAG TPA: hypothetical protein VEP50_14625 [bacterium]|nr:hypothetical protein [bacterium]
MARLVRNLDLAAKLRAVTHEGETVIEGDGDRFLVVRVPQVVELTDPEEVEIALDAAAEYLGPRYGADEALALLQREAPEGRRSD